MSNFVHYAFLLLTALLCCLLPAEANDKRRIVIGTGDGRPYIFTENGSVLPTNPGLSIEILQAAANEHNWEITFAEIPFTRQVSATRSGQIDGLVAVFKDDAPDLIYPNEPIAMAQNCFFINEGAPFHYQSTESLDDIILGVTNGYHYGEIDDYVAQNSKKNILKVSGEDKASLSTLLRLLQVNRIDAFVESSRVVEHAIKAQNIKGIKKAGCTAPMYAYIAFTPDLDVSVSLANDIDATVTRLRASGELDAILKKYGVDDWK